MTDFNTAQSSASRIDAALPTRPASQDVDQSRSVATGTQATATIALAEETLSVSARDVVTGKVRASTRTETYDDIAEITLDRTVVDVTRVPIGRIVDVAPSVRTEGDTTIVPVIEERVIVVKQIYLKEEMHIRHRVEEELSRTPVQLRRQVAVVERLNADGQLVPDDAAPQS